MQNSTHKTTKQRRYRSVCHVFHMISTWIEITNEYLLQELDVDLESRGDVLILSPVSRKDSGIYQCRPLDADGYTEVKGEMQLTVHCEKPSLTHTHTDMMQTH